MFISILGKVTEEKEMSVRATWLRKKYMGVWRQGSSLMSRMMSGFSSTVVRYMPRKRVKSGPAALDGWGAPGG